MPQKDVEYLKMFFDERIKNLEKDIQKNFEILIEKHDNSAERITKIEVETEFFRLCHRYPKTAILIVA
jgi:succinate dehydrogenase flavin-adding protein (antitoxin of CptAB toxin-antitoxin module)